MKKDLLVFFLVMFGLSVYKGQNKTISNKTVDEREVASAHKVMLIPFEPKLYLSEIDHHINQETKLSSRAIRNKFRDGINEQLYKAFKSAKFNVVDLMDDTVKYKKDIEGIYQYLTYEFQKVPDQAHYKPPKKEKDDKKIEKGQLNVETDGEARFMNAKLLNAKVVPLLYAKYKTDIFVFINQLDIKSGGAYNDNVGSGGGSDNRKIVVHYTVYTLDAREINSGIAEEEFDPLLNNPKKIIDKHFAKIAATIVQRVNKGLTVKP